jgi:Rieske Fe-S protein
LFSLRGQGCEPVTKQELTPGHGWRTMTPMENEKKLDRRAFISKALFGLLGLLGLGFLIPALGVLTPARLRQRVITFVPLLPEEDLPRQGVRKAELVYRVSDREIRTRVFLVVDHDDVRAFSAVCSHLGCLVNYHRKTKEFVCPCHGGKYDRQGVNIAGPPPSPLTRLPVKVEKGTVLVGVKV